LAGSPLPLRVEGVEVGGGELGQLLHLTFAQPLSGRSLDRIVPAFERAPRCLQRRQPAQAVRLGLDGQVQGRVGRVQIDVPGLTVGQTAGPDLTEHRQQPPAVAALDAAPDGTIGTDNLFEAWLAPGA
jgi:hypothetical protein